MQPGRVTLVGAGPGPIDFLTLAAYKALQEAEVILYDALLSAEFHKIFPKRARVLYVGKRCGQHAFSQPEINALLVQHAQEGKSVVRLKGGDPFIFGRGGEEIAALREAGIQWQVIPGVSALNGIAAQIGLPLTLRSASNEFRAIQGHQISDSPQWWQDLARYEGTIALFMGLDRLPETLQKLLAAGADPGLPIAVVESASHAQCDVFVSSLSSVLSKGYSRKGQGPAIIYLGKNIDFIDRSSLPQKFPERESDYERILTHFSRSQG